MVKELGLWLLKDYLTFMSYHFPELGKARWFNKLYLVAYQR